jgi:Raf kinase inhibitor-like YbhB/YbcL family protein
MSWATTFLAAAVTTLGAPAIAAMTISSSDIQPNGPIAQVHVYTRCSGQNLSPQLSWGGAPPGTRSLVLTMIDLDANPPAQWSHWIVVDLPPTVTSLARGVRSLPSPARAVAGNFGHPAYDGPCPPKGSGVHHYKFTIWAMRTAATVIVPDARAATIAPSLAKRAIANASFMGTAER